MKRILLVDDHDIVRFGLKSLLKNIESQIEVLEVQNLTEARVRLKNQVFDLVIVDHGLPDGTGFDLIQ